MPATFIKTEALAQVFYCEFCEISKNTFLHRTPVVVASASIYLFKVCWNDHLVGEYLSANISLWNPYKYISFNIFSCRIFDNFV